MKNISSSKSLTVDLSVVSKNKPASKIVGIIFMGLSFAVTVMPAAMAETFSIDGMALNTNNNFPLKDGQPIMSTWKLNPNDNDQQFDRQGNSLRHRSTGKCLNAYQPSVGSTVNVWPCNGSDGDQQFSILSAGGNVSLIQRKGTNLCLDMDSRNANTRMKLWDCNANFVNQRFVSNASAAIDNSQQLRDQAARDQAARDQAARDQAARDQAARDRAAQPSVYSGKNSSNIPSNTAMAKGSSLLSNNRCFRLDAQNDGNLVLYRNSNNQALWESRTYNRNVQQTIFQSDGNLVIYNANNNPVWASGTDRRGGTRLTVQDDGNFVMYNSQNQALWASNTVRSCNVEPIKQTLPTQRASQVNVNNFVKAFPPGTKQITRREGNSYYPGQCVTLIVRYLQEYYKALEKYQSDPGYSNGGQTAARVAQLFPNDFSSISNTDDPIPGSIISFPNAAYSGNCNGRLCGHVALVVNSTRNGNNLQVTILDSNWNSKALQGGAFVEQRSLTIYNPPRTSTASSSDRAYGSGISWVNPKN